MDGVHMNRSPIDNVSDGCRKCGATNTVMLVFGGCWCDKFKLPFNFFVLSYHGPKHGKPHLKWCRDDQ
jgi:hypothetical protein